MTEKVYNYIRKLFKDGKININSIELYKPDPYTGETKFIPTYVDMVNYVIRFKFMGFSKLSDNPKRIEFERFHILNSIRTIKYSRKTK